MKWKNRDSEENKINGIIKEQEEEEEKTTGEGRRNGKKEHWCNTTRDMKIAS